MPAPATPAGRSTFHSASTALSGMRVIAGTVGGEAGVQLGKSLTPPALAYFGRSRLGNGLAVNFNDFSA